MIDALADILYVVYGMACRMGVNIESVSNIVHDNNMSKLCKDEETAKMTVEKYSNNFPEEKFDYRLVKDGRFAVFNINTGKVMKSIDWKPIVWSEIDPEELRLE
jgi:hypothetical protein